MPESTRELSTHPKIVFKPISELKRYENNPRKNEHAVRAIANSIKEFGFKVPIVIDCNDVIVCGDTRYQACFELGITEVPCIIADDLSEEQVRAYRLADNKTAEIADWDFEKLAEELDDILNIDMEQFGFGEADTLDSDKMFGEKDNPYTSNLNCPQYEPTGKDVPLESLVDTSKTDQLLEEIAVADVPDDVKRFLRLGAQRHLRFDYRNIAEYYSNAPPEIQDLFERSALVIIDYEDAMKYGFVRATSALEEIFQSESEDEDDGPF